MNFDGSPALGPATGYSQPPHMNNVRGHDDDSGQGSSLDRDYPHSNGYIDKNGGGYGSSNKQPPTPSNQSRGQYYYNLPQGSVSLYIFIYCQINYL